MLTRNEVVDLLKVIVAYDGRNPGEADVLAWSEASSRGRWTFADALDAVHEHHANSTDWIKPGHVTELLRHNRTAPPVYGELGGRPALNESGKPIARPETIKRIMGEIRAILERKKGNE